MTHPIKRWAAPIFPSLAAALLLAVGLTLPGCSGGSRAERLLQNRCGRCHEPDHALEKHKTREGWKRTIWAMRQRGAELTDEEAQILVDYLTRTQGK